MRDLIEKAGPVMISLRFFKVPLAYFFSGPNFPSSNRIVTFFEKIVHFVTQFLEGLSQVGFAEFNNTADNRANIGGTIIGAPIVGQ